MYIHVYGCHHNCGKLICKTYFKNVFMLTSILTSFKRTCNAVPNNCNNKPNTMGNYLKNSPSFSKVSLNANQYSIYFRVE